MRTWGAVSGFIAFVAAVILAGCAQQKAPSTSKPAATETTANTPIPEFSTPTYYPFTASNRSFSIELPAPAHSFPMPVPPSAAGSRGEIIYAYDGRGTAFTISHITFPKNAKINIADRMRNSALAGARAVHGEVSAYHEMYFGRYDGANAVMVSGEGKPYYLRIIYNGRDLLALSSANQGDLEIALETLVVHSGSADVEPTRRGPSGI